MPVSPYLDEESLMAVVDDVWSLLSPSSSPIHHLKSVAGDAAVTDTANVVAAQTAVKKRKKRRPDRNRPHHEIARLRAQAAELESQLQKQTTKDTRYYTNVGLKAMLRESFDDIYALEQNLNTQMEELLRGMPRVLAAMSRNLPYDITQDDGMFAMMARSLDDQYTNMDQVLRVAGLDKITSEVADASICHSNDAIGNYGVTLKSRTCIFSPFRSDCSVGALWRHFERCQRATMDSTQFRNLDLPLGISSRVAIQKFEVTLGDYVCAMRMVVKQFVERDRIVHVWNVHADVGALFNVETCETGWGFIRPMNNDKTSVCVSYSLVNVTAQCFSSKETCGTINSLIKLYHTFIISRLQALENQTLDRLILDRNAVVS
ncbi:hypothetical protein L916_12887 [Phytophthora nicotianae]|uniref:START domain-containing protein n=1 Tax=Phytophthora nicotianae TaxID=4792 RepID=W2INF7_PHYNI|nr:hypothetical protein L916_12887 [Phytophthora nicotianae]